MNIVDSSGWLEYFSGSDRSFYFSKSIEDTTKLIVPTITLSEVFKKICNERNEDSALKAIAHMQQGIVVDLDSNLAVFAAQLGIQFKLPLIDSIILATAYKFKATLFTQDSDFFGIDGVKYFPKGTKK